MVTVSVPAEVDNRPLWHRGPDHARPAEVPLAEPPTVVGSCAAGPDYWLSAIVSSPATGD